MAHVPYRFHLWVLCCSLSCGGDGTENADAHHDADVETDVDLVRDAGGDSDAETAADGDQLDAFDADDGTSFDADVDEDQTIPPPGPCSWRPLISPAGHDQVVDLLPVDETNWWLVVSRSFFDATPSLYRTTTAGLGWQGLLTDDDLSGVRFADGGQYLWAWTNETYAGTTFWASDDWGETFTRRADIADHLLSAHFDDSEHGFYLNDDADQLCRTDTGGTLWDCEELDFESLRSARGLAVLDTHIWLVGGRDNSHDASGAVVIHSPDRGRTWEEHSFSSNIRDLPGGSLLHIFAVTADELWAVGKNRQMYRTHDGWDSHEQIMSIPEQVLHIDGIAFAGDHGVAVTSFARVLESYDGGQTWEVTADDPDWMKVSVRIVPTTSQFLLFESHGWIYRCE